MYGQHVHEAVAAAGESESGITIHSINEHYDEGNVIFQTTCLLLPTDTPEMIAEKVHALEYEFLLINFVIFAQIIPFCADKQPLLWLYVLPFGLQVPAPMPRILSVFFETIPDSNFR